MVDNLKSPTINDIAQMIDISAVRAENADHHIQEAVDCARQYNFYLVTVLPSQTARAKDLIAGNPMPKLGGNVGFPSGGQTTSIKVAETRELVALDVDEIDMVINIGAHLSGRYDDVYRDIAAVVESAENKPVKAILECYYLSDDQIRVGCDLAIQAGAAFVKTGTGWTPTSATLENLTLIKRHVGDTIQIKASGGIRGAETLLEMHRRGASRFGVSLTYASKIFEALERHR